MNSAHMHFVRTKKHNNIIAMLDFIDGEYTRVDSETKTESLRLNFLFFHIRYRRFTAPCNSKR